VGNNKKKMSPRRKAEEKHEEHFYFPLALLLPSAVGLKVIKKKFGNDFIF